MSDPSATNRPRLNRDGEGHDYAAVVVTFQTHGPKTYVSARLARDVAPRGRNLDLGHLWLDCGRPDLAGLVPAACVSLLCHALGTAIDGRNVPQQTLDGHSGAPLGATGGTVTQLPLPGL